MPRPAPPPLPDDILDTLNAQRGGFNEAIGLRFTRASHDALEAEIPISPRLHQPYGLVHGGVYCAIVETLASTAALLQGRLEETRIVGLENATSFLRATREGTLRARASPLARGRRSQVWQVEVKNDDDKVVATGKVRLLALEATAELAGAKLETKG